MQRDNFTCTHCGTGESTLNVHHCYDETGNDPWDYPSRSLLTLCETCHGKETEFLKIMRRGLQIEMGKHGATSEHFCALATAFSELEPGRFEQSMWFIEFFLRSKEVQNHFFSIAFQGIGAEVEACQSTE